MRGQRGGELLDTQGGTKLLLDAIAGDQTLFVSAGEKCGLETDSYLDPFRGLCPYA